MYCTHYIPSVLVCICTINKDYYLRKINLYYRNQLREYMLQL